MITDFEEAVEFLYGLRLSGMKLGLDNTRWLASQFSLPSKNQKFIHVAGTNGKGSTCAMLESIYRHAGYRTGLYTSPHLIRFNERIRINGIPLPVEQITELAASIQKLLIHDQSGDPESETGHPHVTFFEATTVMAMLAFKKEKTAVNILETGLGGRLDSTNIITPCASIITSIGLDHQKWLGNSLEEIAREKAGIIKPGIPVITGFLPESALRIIQDVAESNESPLHIVEEADIESLIGDIDLPFSPTDYQWRNAALALKAVDVLDEYFPVANSCRSSGITHFKWPGRLQWEQIAGGGAVLLDGAHNPDGMASLASYLESQPHINQCHFLLGFLGDRPVEAMLKPILPFAEKISFAGVPSERGANPSALTMATNAFVGKPLATTFDNETHGDLKEWLKQESLKDTTLVIAGSLHFIGSVMEQVGLDPYPHPAPAPKKAEVNQMGLNDWTKPS